MGVCVMVGPGVGGASMGVTLGTGVSSSLIKVAINGVAVSPIPWSPRALPIRPMSMAGMAI